MDIVIGGFPCQDISVAGKGAGIEGKRSGLWSEIVRLADEIRPRYIFLENVSAITSRGLDTVLADLAEGGFDAEWLCLRASSVGAPHRRERWCCSAYRNDRRQLQPSGTVTNERRRPGDCGEDTDDAMQQQCGGRSRARSVEAGGASGVLGNATSRGVVGVKECGVDSREEANGGRSPHNDDAARSGEMFPFPPGPSDYTRWGAIISDTPHLTPAIEPDVRFMVDGVAYVVDPCRADQLRCSGNGVVPLQAAVAFRELMRRSGAMEES